MKMVYIVLLITGFLLAEPAGLVKSFAGQVLLKKNHGKESVILRNKETELSYGDVLLTKGGASVQIELRNGEILFLKEKASLEITGTVGQNHLVIDVGEFLIGLKKKLASDQKFEVETPACVTGVRGTVFWGLAETNQNTTYAAIENQIEITAKGKKQLLKPGQKLKVEYRNGLGQVEDAKVPMAYLDSFFVDQQDLGLKTLLK